MKGIKSFNTKAAIKTGTSVLVGGVGSAVADWLLDKYQIVPAQYQQYTNLGKVILGAIAGSMVKNEMVKSAFDGIATIGAANLVAEYMPDNATTTTTTTAAPAGLPQGTIGALRLGQRGFRRGAKRVSGLAGADFMSC